MTQVKRRKSWRISCDVGELTERLENEKGLKMNCDVGEATEGLENEL